ncbi:hypothetical protein [Pseudorhodoplanes sp.]|uniref:hypothetical protein n=1 Tax=Pseudorhodoplanes sp. TaxID=1934341 RepID=UPI002B822FFD|nr:hypothetical protein [Pseudorhodoplanes sp.]HWV55719.1 hypothetical protein [Pseudorhodoplanes sp.]
MFDILAAIWVKLPLVLSLGFIGLMLLGFWRGLRIKPRPADEHAPQRGTGW